MIDHAIENSGYSYRSKSLDDWSDSLDDMQSAWREFIEDHRQALREGKRIKLARPPLRGEISMFPPAFQVHSGVRGEPPWPDLRDRGR